MMCLKSVKLPLLTHTDVSFSHLPIIVTKLRVMIRLMAKSAYQRVNHPLWLCLN